MAEIVSAKEQIQNVRQLLERSKSQIAMALPRHMSADRVARIAMTSILRNPRLLECTPQSLIGAVIQSAQLGLEPDDIRGECYLVPYKNGKTGRYEVQLIPGYRGLMNLARRSGKISGIEAAVVFDPDEFSYRKGTDQFLHHIPSDSAGEPVRAYALARFNNSQCQFEVLSKMQIEEIRKRSRAGQNGPWVTDWEEMAKKTVLRRLCKYLPSSPELATAVALDEGAEAGIPQGLELLTDESLVEPTSDQKKHSGLDKLAKELKGGKDVERKQERSSEKSEEPAEGKDQHQENLTGLQ